MNERGKKLISNILIVDDEDTIHDLIRDGVDEYQLCHRVEIDCHSVYTGEEALLHLSEKKDNLPDLIFLDITMPGCGGIITGRQMRTLYNGFVSIVILSTSEKEIKEAQEFVDGYLKKSISYNTFLKNISHALSAFVFKENAMPHEKTSWDSVFSFIRSALT